MADRDLTDYLIQIGIRHLDDQVRLLRLQASQSADQVEASAATSEVARLKMLRELVLRERRLASLTQVH